MGEVEINPVSDRLELTISGSCEVAAAYYRMSGDRVVLTRPIAPKRFSGREIGTQLAHGVFRDIRKNGRKVILVCSFKVNFYTRHHEYGDIVVGSAGQGEAA